MTNAKTIGAYIDCKQVMDMMLQHGTITLDFDRYGEAVHFRQRCYRLRKLIRESARPAPGTLASTPYDSMIIRITDKGVEPIRITLEDRKEHGLSLLSRIRNAEGEPISPEPPEALEDALRKLQGSLGLEQEE